MGLESPFNSKELYGKSFEDDWVARVVFLIQILLILGDHCNPYF